MALDILRHEPCITGHALHTLLANNAQPFEKADYPIFTAEIASTLNELLLLDHMQARQRAQDRHGDRHGRHRR